MMTPERYQKIAQLFHAAQALEPEQRSDYLRRACEGDEALEREVAKLLDGEEAAGNFLSSPAFAVVAEALEGEKAQALIGRRLGRFEILSLLGAGGMGEVYLAKDAQLGRRVALKLLPQAVTSQADRLRRFEREARAASALNHPNIITIHDIGEVDGLHFITTEFIEGEMLRRRIARGCLPVIEALDIAIQVANALDTAHNAGIIHRDIKPENIMLRPDGYVKVLDFGLAKLTEPQVSQPAAESEVATLPIPNDTTAGMIIGTVNYMSPEQARGLRVDSRSDLWSLGVTLYEMVTGSSPFTGETATDVIISIVDRSPQPLTRSAADLPVELERLVMKTLEKNRDHRYQTAKDLVIDLKSLKRQLEMKAEFAQTSPIAVESPTADKLVQESIAIADEKIESVKKPAFSPALITLVALFLVLVGLGSWVLLRPKSAPPLSTPASTSTTASTVPAAPERQISYSLTITKGNNQSIEALGQEIFASSDRFSFKFSSPQAGFVYLLNEEIQKGNKLYTLQFPLPSKDEGATQMAANQSLETGRYFFEAKKKIENILLIWAASPVGALEDVRKSGAYGAISDPRKLAAVKKFLEEHQQAKGKATADDATKQTTVQGSGDVLIHTIKLTHS